MMGNRLRIGTVRAIVISGGERLTVCVYLMCWLPSAMPHIHLLALGVYKHSLSLGAISYPTSLSPNMLAHIRVPSIACRVVWCHLIARLHLLALERVGIVVSSILVNVELLLWLNSISPHRHVRIILC
jgi:hypothetical protein